MELTARGARGLAAILEEHTGQRLGEGRSWRLETALRPLLGQSGCASLDDLAMRAASGDEPDSNRLRVAIVEALLNGETSFFRDRAIFETIRTRILPELPTGDVPARIWSAGCSTGQETYSLAMLLAEDAARWRAHAVELVGSDVSGAAIARARAGLYSTLEVQRGLAIGELLRHFEQAGEDWRVRSEVVGRARFIEAGLLDREPNGRFDLILCRNVLLYFDEDRRRAALARLGAAMAPGGLLLLGAGETALGQSDLLAPDPDLRGFYRRSGREGAGARAASGAMPVRA